MFYKDTAYILVRTGSSSEFGSIFPSWHSKSCTNSRRNPSDHSIASLICMAVDLFALPTLAVWQYRPWLSPVANRAFPVVGAVATRLWNDLPADLTSAESLSPFRRRLKIHLFSKPFRLYFLDIT